MVINIQFLSYEKPSRPVEVGSVLVYHKAWRMTGAKYLGSEGLILVMCPARWLEKALSVSGFLG
jgi:hypothetical protein